MFSLVKSFAYFRLFPPIHLAFVIPAGLASLVSGSLFLQVLYLVNKERRKGEARLKQS